MSCSTPFVLETIVGVVVTSTQNVSLKGSYTLPGYSVPSAQLCWLQWKAPYTETGIDCKKNSWWKVKKCKWAWVKGSKDWCCCWNTPSIPIWPNLTFTGSVTMPFTFTASAGIILTPEAPPTPYQSLSITLESCVCSLGINGTDVDVNILPGPIAVQQVNGSFSTDIELYGFSASVTEAGVEYSLSITSSLQLCLDPIPPVGWINLLLDCNLSAFEKGIVNYTTKFAISLPIVSVEG